MRRLCISWRTLRAPVAQIALVAARALRAGRAWGSVVALGSTGTFGAALASVSLGTCRPRRARNALRRAPGHQFCDLLLQGLDARVGAIEFYANRIAELRIRATIEENGRHRVRGFCWRGRDRGMDFTAPLGRSMSAKNKYVSAPFQPSPIQVVTHNLPSAPSAPPVLVPIRPPSPPAPLPIQVVPHLVNFPPPVVVNARPPLPAKAPAPGATAPYIAGPNSMVRKSRHRRTASRRASRRTASRRGGRR